MPDQSICAQLRNQLVATRAERFRRVTGAPFNLVLEARL